MGFPSHSLQAIGGEIYCHIFENCHIGLPRNLFWSITVNFAPLRYGGDECDCSMICEWIVWPLQSWKDMHGKRLDVGYGENGIESSFYMAEHHAGSRTRLKLQRQHHNLFRVEMDMSVEFGGYLGGDEEPAMPVHADGSVPFTGLIVVPDNLFPKPNTVYEVKAVASQFMELRDFEEPEQRDRDFIFRPRY